MVYTQMNREKLMKMANTVRTGGKGTVRRYRVLFNQFHCSILSIYYDLCYETIRFLLAERRRLCTRPIQLMTRGFKALLRELELTPFPLLNSMTTRLNVEGSGING
jgi:hypothetical protein